VPPSSADAEHGAEVSGRADGDRSADLMRLRDVVYRRFATAGAPPSPTEAAASLGIDVSAVVAGWRELHDRHQLVLGPGGDSIRMAHPFSALPMGFVLRADDDRLWWGGCAWDSFGIVAALHEELELLARCPQCGRSVAMRVGPDRPPPALTIRIPRPAAEWWDDVVKTCNDIRLYCGEDHARAFVARCGLAAGVLVDAERMWRLAQPWYGDRLDPDYAPRSREDRQRLLAESGLDGPFWQLP